MRKIAVFIAIFLVLLLAPTGWRFLKYYQLGGRQVSPPPSYDPAQVSAVSAVPTPASTAFVDQPQVGQGIVLLDRAHRNEFTLEEMGPLDARLAARGYELVSFTSGNLERALRKATSFVVIAPLDTFTTEEVRAVTEFVDRGGRLLLIGDPTRFSLSFDESLFSFSVTIESSKLPLNSLANEFNIIFNGDYLYNTVENEGNFRNIILQSGAFAEDSLTDGLDKIVFYSAHSLQVGGSGKALLLADANTWSSATDRPGGLIVGASSRDGRVVALGDVHFLIEPYHTVFDNGRFIAQLADFLAGVAQRDFVLADFPYFFRQPVDLIFTGSPQLGPGIFDEIIALQTAFRGVGKDLQLAAASQNNRDVLYLGLFNQAGEVLDLLASEGISLTIQPPILTAAEQRALAAVAEKGNEDGTTADPDAENERKDESEPQESMDTLRLIESELGKVQMSGTAVILLLENQAQRSVIVLASSTSGLEATVDRLLDLIPLSNSQVLSDCLVRQNLALCPTNVANEEVEAELASGGKPSASEEGETTTSPEEETEEISGFPPGEEPNIQGAIGLDETVNGTLGEAEIHGWTFSEGPMVIDIEVTSEQLDLVLELYDANARLLESADSGFFADSEALLNIEIPDDKTYIIVVRDYFGDAGEYELTVTAVSPIGEAGSRQTISGVETVFILVDDDGQALNGGVPSGAALQDLLGDQLTVTLWVTSIDGPLSEDALDDVDLLIWDTADYLDTAGFLDPDTEIIFNFLDSGTGSLLIIGSAPILFNYFERSPLADLEVAVSDSVLLNGFSQGEIIALDRTYQTIASDLFGEDFSDEDVLLFLRGPDSGLSGTPAAVATVGGLGTGQRLAVIFFPFVAMPQAVQETLLQNFLLWFSE